MKPLKKTAATHESCVSSSNALGRSVRSVGRREKVCRQCCQHTVKAPKGQPGRHVVTPINWKFSLSLSPLHTCATIYVANNYMMAEKIVHLTIAF